MSIVDVMRVRVVSVEPDDSVALAVDRMVSEGVGAVAVCESGRLVGMFSERDVLRLAATGVPFLEGPVREVMTSRVITAAADDDLVGVARVMGERRIRHVPVVEDGRLLGIVSMREVMGALVERAWRRQDDEAHETAQALLGHAR